MTLDELHAKQVCEMADQLKLHVANGDLHRAALVAASMSGMLATMMAITCFERGMAEERERRDAFEAAERAGRASAEEFIRRVGGGVVVTESEVR